MNHEVPYVQVDLQSVSDLIMVTGTSDLCYDHTAIHIFRPETRTGLRSRVFGGMTAQTAPGPVVLFDHVHLRASHRFARALALGEVQLEEHAVKTYEYATGPDNSTAL